MPVCIQLSTNMYSTRLLITLCLCSFGTLASSKSVPVFGYHKQVGIPQALELYSKEFSVSRIVGGSQVSTQSPIPYQAGIVITLTKGGTSICGGSLISNSRVLTAAHCWWDGEIQAKTFTIVLGSLTIFTGGTRVATNNVVVHPNWDTEDITNDIAIVKMSHVAYSNSIQAIALPAASDAGQDFSGQTAIASGYGKTSDAQKDFPSTTSLYQVSLKVIKNTECQKTFDFPIHGSHLCTSGEAKVGTCEGDSGGPLTVLWKNKRTLIGVVSFGLGDGCQLGIPSVYTRVSAFLSWINGNM